jgi:hypothetical protein
MWLPAALLCAVVVALLACDAGATQLRGRVAASLLSGGMSAGSTTIPAGSMCRSPVPRSSTLGCVDFVQTGMQALDLVVSTIDANGVGGDTNFLNQFFRPVLSALRESVGRSFPGLNSNVCLGNFMGSAISSAPPAGINSAMYADKVRVLTLRCSPLRSVIP